MLVEAVAAGKTVAEATELAAAQLGVPVSAVQTEILEEPKRSLLGKIKGEARVRVFYEKEEQTKIQIAKEYINTILTAMGLSGFTITESGDEDHAVLNIEGEGLGVIIGRRGETLDAIQYLASLAANRLGGDYFRITVDSGDYRSKREKTLIHLAEKLSKTVLRTGRSSLRQLGETGLRPPPGRKRPERPPPLRQPQEGRGCASQEYESLQGGADLLRSGVYQGGEDRAREKCQAV